MSSTFGKRFTITTFGESHGRSVGVVIDGIPAGLKFDLNYVQHQMARRRPGQSHLTTPRTETDQIIVHSGIEDGLSLGSPVTMLVENQDQRPDDYKDIEDALRPSHADFTTLARFGIKSKSGSGRSSARETIGRVAGGAVAELMLSQVLPQFSIVAWVHAVGDIMCPTIAEDTVTRDEVDSSEVRCPFPDAARKMIQLIEQAKAEGDSVGGIIRCVMRGVPAGLGEPVFDKLEADLAKAMLSLPATKGFEIGSGFAGTRLKGSTHNDPFEVRDGVVRTTTNHSGGIQGGISNGEMIVFNVAFKPVATIAKSQNTVSVSGKPVVISPKHVSGKPVVISPNQGGHEPWVLPRAIPMVESMAALVVADHWLRHLDSRL
ncbi:MAG: chorismate synthase [Proteobacteria bacterium]|nr:chorismate synthase [Pseudomonadota bacterium]